MRELIWMAEAKQQSEWMQTASILCVLANCNRNTKKSKSFTVDDFLPDQFKSKKAKKDAIEEISSFRDLKKMMGIKKHGDK